GRDSPAQAKGSSVRRLPAPETSGTLPTSMLKESGSGIRIGWYLRTLPVQRIWRDGGLSLPLWERLSEDSTVSSRPASPRVSRVLNWLDRLSRHTGWARVRAATEIARGTS